MSTKKVQYMMHHGTQEITTSEDSLHIHSQRHLQDTQHTKDRRIRTSSNGTLTQLLQYDEHQPTKRKQPKLANCMNPLEHKEPQI